MMPDASELARMREDIQNAILPDSGYILNVTNTADGQGGVTQAWGTADSTKLRIDPLTASEVLAGGKIEMFHGFTISLPQGKTVTSEDRIEIDGTAYNVITVDTGKSWDACIRIKAQKA